MVRFHFGNVTKACTTSEQTDADNGVTPMQLKNDALFPYDTKALIPSCIYTKDGKDYVVYKQGENIWLWATAGLVVLLLLILLIAALKGGGNSGPIIYHD